MELPDNLKPNNLRQNDAQSDDFPEFSPTEVHCLLYDTFGEKSPIQFRDDIDSETLDQIPIFRIAEAFLKLIQRDKKVKLTPLGALPKKVIVELYEERFLPDENIENGIIKLRKEQDVIAIMSARLASEFAGLARKANGRLVLTKKAAKLLESNNRSEIFKQFFQAFTDKLLWSFHDGFPEQPVGQLGWAFSTILLNRFGGQPQTVSFYAHKYLKAFPSFITFFRNDYLTPEQLFVRCYGLRTFKRFFLWFGFATASKQKKLSDLDTDTFTRTDLVERIFKFDGC